MYSFEIYSNGNEDYVPTNMEWLTLYASANWGERFSENGYALGFIQGPDVNTIVIYVSYDPKYGYSLHSDSVDFKINIGTVNELDKKVDRIKLFFTAISKDSRLNNDSILIKEVNVIYKDQIICVN